MLLYSLHGRVIVERALASVKRQAEETKETTRQIVQRELMQVPVANAQKLPTRTALARCVRHRRQMAGQTDEDCVMQSRAGW